jgi:hypothetical protein
MWAASLLISTATCHFGTAFTTAAADHRSFGAYYGG